MALQAWLTWGTGFAPRLAALAAPGPGSNPTLTAVAVALAWLIFGITIVLLTAPSVTTDRAVVTSAMRDLRFCT